MMAVLFLILFGAIAMAGFVLSLVRGLSQWNSNYNKLSKRYGG
jgi:hypothetical protein